MRLEGRRVHPLRVLRTRRLNPGFVRLTVGGAGLHDWPGTGVGDEWVKLFLPAPDEAAPPYPVRGERGWGWPDPDRQVPVRSYTVRDVRPGEVDVDVVVHRGGLASDWVEAARPGQPIGMSAPRAAWAAPSRARSQVLVADESALPAASRVAELTAHRLPTVVLAEVRCPEHVLPLPDGVRTVWSIGTGNGAAPSALLDRLRAGEVAVDADTFVWVAGEARMTRDVRRWLRAETGRPADAQRVVGYWTHEVASWRRRFVGLGPEVHRQLSELAVTEMEAEERTDRLHAIYAAHGL